MHAPQDRVNVAVAAPRAYQGLNRMTLVLACFAGCAAPSPCKLPGDWWVAVAPPATP